MTTNNSPQGTVSTTITLDDLTDRTVGKADELSPQDKARFSLAKWVLLFIALFLLLAFSGRYYATGSNQIDAAKAILDFCSTVAPPIVTLILGYYFGTERAKSTES